MTLPSHVSLLSSLPVVEHGIVDHASPVVRPVRMLPAIFREPAIGPPRSRARCISGRPAPSDNSSRPASITSRCPRRVSKPFLAAETTDQVVAWVRGTCRSPFFAWVHYWDPHMPYTPPAPWHRAYYDDDPYAARHTSMADVRLDWFDYDLDGFRRRLAPFAGPLRALKRDLGASSREVKDLVLYADRLDRHTTDPAERAALRARLRASVIASGATSRFAGTSPTGSPGFAMRASRSPSTPARCRTRTSTSAAWSTSSSASALRGAPSWW